jgi:transcription antitermination protein NusB
VNDRPKTLAERTARPLAGDKARQWIKVKDGRLSGPDPAVELVGTPLSTALSDAQAAESVAAKGSEPRPKPLGTSPKATGSAAKAKHAFAATRSVARKLALQAIYRWLLNDAPWQDLVKEFGEAEDMPNADPKYFRDLVEGVWASRTSLDEKLTELVDRPVEQLDPVEHSVLLIGLYELSAKPDVPYRVAINESVGLAKRFGATDGHKFVNAVMDRAARTLRPGED